jgi:hypothetical protein
MKKTLTASLIAVVLLLPSIHAAANTDRLCDGHNHELKIDSPYNITLDHGDVVTRDGSKEVMRVTSAGELFIKGQRRPIDMAQSELLKTYVANMHQLVDDAKEVGKAGAKLGVQIAGEVIAALFSGNLHEVEDHARTQADSIKQTAKSLCLDVDELRSTQLKLRRSIPEMAPYLPLAQNVI